MAALDESMLYQFEAQVEANFQAFFAANGVTTNIQQAGADLVTPFVETQLTMGSVTGHEGAKPDGDRVYDTWNASIKHTIVTNRTTNGDQHKVLLGKVRLFMYQFEKNFTRQFFPYHEIADVRETGTSIGIIADEDHDETEVNFAIILAIRPDAWPVTE